MSAQAFFTQLAIVTLLAAGAAYGMLALPKLQAYPYVAFGSLAVFFLISIIMYVAGKKAALSENKHNFTNVSLGITIGKIFIAILFILGYDQLLEPASRFFIIPFFIMYLIYTIFETYVMMKLGKMGP